MKTGENDDETDEIASQILNYMAEHPDAQDTVEGITHWWLLEHVIQNQSWKVQRAVAQLVADGWLFREPMSGPNAIYRANPKKLMGGQRQAASAQIVSNKTSDAP